MRSVKAAAKGAEGTALPLLTGGGRIPPAADQPRQEPAWVFASSISTKSFCANEEVLQAAEHNTGEGAAAQGIEFRVLWGGLKELRDNIRQQRLLLLL